ncbi:hypothetical protein B7463_g7728, partial [Scytalidium lignicola]
MASSCGPAPPEDLYPDLEALQTSIQAWAYDNGYAFTRHDNKLYRVIYTCARAGRYQSKGKKFEVHSSKQRKGSSKKCGCNIRVIVTLESSSWRLKVLELTYNHDSNQAIVHLQHRVTTLTTE